MSERESRKKWAGRFFVVIALLLAGPANAFVSLALAHPDNQKPFYSGKDSGGATGKKTVHHGKVFSGILVDVNLKSHPMTLTAENGGAGPEHFVFGGDLLPRALVWKKGKSVGVKALRKGDRVRLVYQNGSDGPQVTHIRILP
jgi:hypothetical protein|uniref:DUF5666 domain-containing protein n=1 Tax=Leptospirillum ferriphilum TaxID=178606 RepID=A0A7C3QWT9_9BACT